MAQSLLLFHALTSSKQTESIPLARAILLSLPAFHVRIHFSFSIFLSLCWLLYTKFSTIISLNLTRHLLYNSTSGYIWPVLGKTLLFSCRIQKQSIITIVMKAIWIYSRCRSKFPTFLFLFSQTHFAYTPSRIYDVSIFIFNQTE